MPELPLFGRVSSLGGTMPFDDTFKRELLSGRSRINIRWSGTVFQPDLEIEWAIKALDKAAKGWPKKVDLSVNHLIKTVPSRHILGQIFGSYMVGRIKMSQAGVMSFGPFHAPWWLFEHERNLWAWYLDQLWRQAIQAGGVLDLDERMLKDERGSLQSASEDLRLF